jgi:acetyl-CoA carboxylase carboxyl transferase subunit alpha
VSVVIGEGGSGGALAIGVADRLLMLENSTYSVISPESCAAILWGHAGEARQAAAALKIGARHVKEMGICDEIILEGGEGAHESFDLSAHNLLSSIVRNFEELSRLPLSELQERRFKKYRSLGAI